MSRDVNLVKIIESFVQATGECRPRVIYSSGDARLGISPRQTALTSIVKAYKNLCDIGFPTPSLAELFHKLDLDTRNASLTRTELDSTSAVKSFLALAFYSRPDLLVLRQTFDSDQQIFENVSVYFEFLSFMHEYWGTRFVIETQNPIVQGYVDRNSFYDSRFIWEPSALTLAQVRDE